ncbi:unnamed protein product, partial [Laminaria digitata]
AATAEVCSDNGMYTVFYCSAKLGGFSPLCVAGAASRELVTTASEAVSHAALVDQSRQPPWFELDRTALSEAVSPWV